MYLSLFFFLFSFHPPFLQNVCVHSRLLVQEDDAEQNATGVGGLRGGELGQAAKDVFAKVGIYLYAGGSAEQGRQEEGQAGEEGSG